MNGLETVPCPLHAASLASPDAPAIIGPSGKLTYAELDLWVSAASESLAKIGVETGDRVALYLPKDERYVVLLLAMIRAGIIACPVSTRFPPAGVVPLLRRAACKALVSEDEDLFQAVDDAVRKLRPGALLKTDLDRIEPPDPPELSLSRAATVVFTSGSAGAPKAALHTFGNHYYNALGSNENITLDPKHGDRWLHSLPLYHVGGLSILFRCLLAGTTMALLDSAVPIARSISESGATHVSLVAAQLRRLLAEDADLGGLKAILLGGSGIPEDLLDEAHGRGLPVHTSYGLTEMASQATTTHPGASRDELRTSGTALRYRRVKVAGDGEILVSGETLFAGYLHEVGLEEPFDEAGWFHTRDTGEIDGEGRLRFAGRKDNLFVSGGENVQPEEIEAGLRRLESVEDAVVVPVPDAEFGERPVAFVQMKKGGGPPPQDISAELSQVLPRFKIPVSFHAWPEDAGQAGMKVDRAFFRERAKRLSSEGG
ncbi:MAG: o-succinylbenzoate--CoA ligase [Rubrobacter sp.]|nr:o-succinylbenzoate--CoA ligase [Rubrobacter sp.]